MPAVTSAITSTETLAIVSAVLTASLAKIPKDDPLREKVAELASCLRHFEETVGLPRR
jgi:hypothetical protein